MPGIALGVNLICGTRGGSSAGPVAPLAAAFLGQSEIDYLFNTGATYRQITQPTPGNGNLIVFVQGDPGAAPVRTVVNATTVAAGSINPAMAAMSAWLAHVTPGQTYVLGDICTPGTSRYQLVDDTESERLWTDLEAVVTAVETEAGRPLQSLIECWYNSDASSIGNFRSSFWPMYFGANGDGTAFTLGNTNPAASVTTARFDHCLWDASAAAGAKGRGVLTRADTKWRILTPMPFNDGPVSPSAEAAAYSQGLRLSEPARQTMIDLAANALAQSVDLKVGPSAHITYFEGGIHPATEEPDGQILFMWPFALRLAELGGLVVNEPTIEPTIEGPADGSYADILVNLPNGGNLTTVRALESRAAPVSPPPHYQAVVGVEANKGGSRRPIFATTETSYPASHRGTVTIVDAGSGSPRRGRVRVTPTVAFGFGDTLSYLRGQANAMLIEPRDADARLYLNMLIETVPAWRNAGLYRFPGVPVRPLQSDLAVAVPAPPFSPQSTNFNGTSSGLDSTTLAFAGTAEGTMAFWIYVPTAWPSSGQIIQIRNGAAITLEARLASTGRITFDAKGATATTVPTNTFAVDRWHHVIWSWKAGAGGWNQISVDGAAPIAGQSLTSATLTINGSQTRWYTGNSATALRLAADLAYVYADLDTALDLTVAANRQKFLLAKQPVFLGANGELATGAVPHFFLDGGAAMVNLGSAGGLTGADLTAGRTPALP